MRVKEIASYSEMIVSLIRRELRGRYQKSFLGILWNFLNPLCQILVYTIVFQFIFNNGMENFYIYLSIGTIPWCFFSEAVTVGAGSIVANSDMVKKIYFPREVLCIASVTAKFINMVLSFSIIFLFLFLSGMGVKPQLLLWLLPVMAAEYFTTLGMALFFSSVTVYLRDVEYIVGVLMMGWVWATPIMYTIDGLGTEVVRILLLNPLTRIIIAFHDILYYQTAPNGVSILAALILGVAILVIGEVTFVGLEKNFAEEL